MRGCWARPLRIWWMGRGRNVPFPTVGTEGAPSVSYRFYWNGNHKIAVSRHSSHAWHKKARFVIHPQLRSRYAAASTCDVRWVEAGVTCWCAKRWERLSWKIKNVRYFDGNILSKWLFKIFHLEINNRSRGCKAGDSLGIVRHIISNTHAFVRLETSLWQSILMRLHAKSVSVGGLQQCFFLEMAWKIHTWWFAVVVMCCVTCFYETCSCLAYLRRAARKFVNIAGIMRHVVKKICHHPKTWLLFFPWVLVHE